MEITERLESERLIYKRVDKLDFLDVHKLFYSENSQTFKYCSWSKHRSKRDTSDYIEKRQKDWLTNERYEYGIIEKESSNVIGTCYIKPAAELEVFVFGIWISEEYQSKGYSQERAHKFIKYLFDDMKASAIRVGCLKNNEKSLRSIASYVSEYGGHYNGIIPVMNTEYNYDMKPGIVMHHEFSITRDQYYSDSTGITTPIEKDIMSDIGVEI